MANIDTEKLKDFISCNNFGIDKYLTQPEDGTLVIDRYDFPEKIAAFGEKWNILLGPRVATTTTMGTMIVIQNTSGDLNLTTFSGESIVIQNCKVKSMGIFGGYKSIVIRDCDISPKLILFQNKGSIADEVLIERCNINMAEIKTMDEITYPITPPYEIQWTINNMRIMDSGIDKPFNTKNGLAHRLVKTNNLEVENCTFGESNKTLGFIKATLGR